MPRPPVLGYLQSAVADNTAHSQMDKLLFEDEMSNIQPEWGTYSEEQEGYDPAREFAEGMMPIGKGATIIGNMIGGKYIPDRVLKKRISNNKLADSFAEKIKELKKSIDDKGFMGYASTSEIIKAKKKMKELRDSYDKLRPVMKGRNFQQGGPISLLQPAIQDETAHSQMDRLMFENELEQQPQHSMRTYQQGYDPAREWGEGMMPIGGALRLLKGSDKYLDMLKSVSKTAAREKKNIEAISDAHKNIARAGERGQMKGTPKEFLDYHKRKVSESDKNIKDYAITKWIQRLLQ